MNNTIIGLLVATFGIILAVFRKAAIKQRAVFERYQFGIKYTPAMVRWSERLMIVGGICFFLLGMLIVAGILKLK